MEDTSVLDKGMDTPDEETEPPSTLACRGRIPKLNLVSRAPSPTMPSPLPLPEHRSLRPKRSDDSSPAFPSRPSDSFRRRVYPTASASDWNDWRWQLHHRIRELDELARIIELSEDERSAIADHKGHLPLAITPYYASLLEANNPLQPLRRTVVPVSAEYCRTNGEAEDPLGEEQDSPFPAWCTAIRTARCFSSPVSAPPTVDTAPDPGWWAAIMSTVSMQDRPGTGHRLSRKDAGRARRAAFRRGSLDALRRETRMDPLEARRHSSCRIPAPRHQGARGSAPAHHPGPDPDAEALSSAVDEHSFHPPRRADARGGAGLQPAGGRRYPSGQPDGLALRGERSASRP